MMDTGDRVTHAASMFRDYVLPYTLLCLDPTGRLVKLPSKCGYSLIIEEWEINRNIKEKLCYVVLDFQ